MKKILILITTFMGLMGLVFPNFNEKDIKISQINHYFDEKEIIKPNSLAPNYSVTNANSDTIFITDYFAPYYFKKLNGRFGNNKKGSCSYVAVDMLLSYYDSFWNDNFLPEKYDGENVFVDETILNATESPGSKNENDIYANQSFLSDEEYFNLVNRYSNDIVHFDLISIGIKQLNLYNSETKKLSLGTFLEDMQNVIRTYLDDSTTLGRNSINIRVAGLKDSDSEKKRKIIIDKVSQGIPVIVDAVNDEQNAHSFIAYDYDKENDEIYCNAGWYNDFTHHISMSDLGYTYIQEILYFEPLIDHQNCLNYSRLDEEGDLINICACSSMIPSKIEIINNYLDVTPTFRWNSLIKEKWSEKHKFHHLLSILRSDLHEAFDIDNIYDNQYSLSVQNWAKVINEVANPVYYVHITVCSDTYPYWDDYYCVQLFTEPNRYKLKSSFLPQDWDFEGRYYFSNELNSSNLESDPKRMYTTVTQNGLTIETERLRCGYIEESYIVLSPRRKDAGRSYFEMNFDKPVYSFMYRACMWSASENLDGIAIIQVKNIEGTWSTLKDIPISSLKTKEDGLTQFVELTLSGIYGLRFEVTSTATGSRNKGRFCLGDIVFSTASLNVLYPYVDYDYVI